jgi:hypothetical protein
MTDWWLNGGILVADCVGAYQAIGAASYNASLVNLANPGTYDLTEPLSAVGWNATDGWVGDGTNYLETGINPYLDWSIIVRVEPLVIDNILAGIILADGAGESFGLSSTSYLGLPTELRYTFSNKGGGLGITKEYDTNEHQHILGIVGAYSYFEDSLVDTGTPLFTGAETLAIFKGYDVYHGKIKAIAIYNRTLSANEYLDVWAAISGLPDDPIDYLPIHSAGSNIYVIP